MGGGTYITNRTRAGVELQSPSLYDVTWYVVGQCSFFVANACTRARTLTFPTRYVASHAELMCVTTLALWLVEYHGVGLCTYNVHISGTCVHS